MFRLCLCLLLAPSFVWAQSNRRSPVAVAPVVEAEVQLGHRVVGTVKPLRRSTIGSAVDGRVQAFSLRRGQAVKQGQELAQLRVETTDIELAAARSELTLYQRQLDELKNGTLPEAIDEARANLQAAEAAYAYAAKRLTRLKSLSASRAASETDLEQAAERVETTRFRKLALATLLKRAEDGPRPESIGQAEAQVELQRQRVRLLEDRREKLTIRAPFDGYIAQEFTQVGAWISRGDPVAEVVEMASVEIEVPVTAEHAPHIRPGDALRVEFPELPELSLELPIGTVDRIVPVAEQRARTFPLFVRVENRIAGGVPQLLAGMLARVDLPVGRRERMPLVPKDALVLNGQQRCVFVVDDLKDQQGVARRVPVQLGIAVEGRIQVRGDVRQGDVVVVGGNERLAHGAAVAVVRRADQEPPSSSVSVAD